jgi:MoxR-like ATPase
MSYINNTGLPMAKCWQDFHDVLQCGIDRVVLYGAPGTGKTFGGLTYGNVGNGVFRLTCTEDMTSADIEGTWKPNGDNWTFSEGKAVQAWRAGGRLVVDEGDKASGDVQGQLLNFLDSVASSSWQNPDTGEIVTPKSGFSAVITSNIEHPDDLPIALRDRFPVAIEINAPHPEALAKLPEHLRTVATAVISAEPERRVSLRAFYAFQQLITNGMQEERSAEMTFGKVRAEAIIEAVRIGRLGSVSSPSSLSL